MIKRMSSVLVAAAALFIGLNASAATIPNYVAVDYNTPGHHPRLTPAQMARIRQVLARVKPCQRSLVRYATVEKDADYKDGIVLFFWPSDDIGPGSHVFDKPNIFYLPSMGVFAGPLEDGTIEDQAKQGIQWDIDRQPCLK